MNALTIAIIRCLGDVANELLSDDAWSVSIRRIGANPTEEAHFGKDGCVIELASVYAPEDATAVMFWAYSMPDGRSYEGEWLDVSLTDGTRFELMFENDGEHRFASVLQEIAVLARSVFGGTVETESGRIFRPYPSALSA